MPQEWSVITLVLQLCFKYKMTKRQIIPFSEQFYIQYKHVCYRVVLRRNLNSTVLHGARGADLC